MCLLTDNPIPKVAQKPIRVWKQLIKTYNGFRTPYRDFVVNIGDTIKAKEPNAFIESAPHTNTVFCIDKQGVHAYTTRNKAEAYKLEIPKLYSEIITEWEIPVGAKYWVGNEDSEDEIAATEMTFIKVCEAKIKKLAQTKLEDKWVDDILAQTILPEDSYKIFED